MWSDATSPGASQFTLAVTERNASRHPIQNFTLAAFAYNNKPARFLRAKQVPDDFSMDKYKQNLLDRNQTPPLGLFCLSNLRWEAYKAGNVAEGSIVDAIIPHNRIDDLIKGEEKAGICGFTTIRTKTNSLGSLTCPKQSSYLSSREYNCQFGPEDLREGSEAYSAFVDGHEGRIVMLR